MTENALYGTIGVRFFEVLREKKLLDQRIPVMVRTMTASEVLGSVERSDYSLLTGADAMIEASCLGGKGQAYVPAPITYDGELVPLVQAGLEKDGILRGAAIAAINAVMCRLGLADRALHCKNEDVAHCGSRLGEKLAAMYGQDTRVLQVGYQPSILSNLVKHFCHVRALDLNPANVGYERFGVMIEDGNADMADAVSWSELILCTGSTVCNGTLTDYIATGKPTLFFGTSISGTAALLGLERICFSGCV